MLAAILWPVAEWFKRRRIPWSISCMMSVGLLVVAFLVITLGFTLSVPKMLQGLPHPNDYSAQKQYYAQFRNQVVHISPVGVEGILPEDAERSRVFLYVRETINGPFMTNQLLKLVGYLNEWIVDFVLIMFILLFLLLE